MTTTPREILFTGKKIDTGEWIEGSYVFLQEDESCHYIVTADKQFHRVDSTTVGQYIGYNDKYHRKIFEGHIVKFLDSIRVVRYWHGAFELRVRTLTTPFCHPDFFYDYEGTDAIDGTETTLEIIGNIYDNRELLMRNVRDKEE